MGAIYVTIEVGGVRGERFEGVNVRVDAGAMFTTVPGDLLRRLGVPVQETVQSVLADGSLTPIEVADTMIRVEGRQFPSPVIFGKAGEPNLLGFMALKRAKLAVDPVHGWLIAVNVLRVASRSG